MRKIFEEKKKKLKLSNTLLNVVCHITAPINYGKFSRNSSKYFLDQNHGKGFIFCCIFFVYNN